METGKKNDKKKMKKQVIVLLCSLGIIAVLFGLCLYHTYLDIFFFLKVSSNTGDIKVTDVVAVGEDKQSSIEPTFFSEDKYAIPKLLRHYMIQCEMDGKKYDIFVEYRVADIRMSDYVLSYKSIFSREKLEVVIDPQTDGTVSVQLKRPDGRVLDDKRYDEGEVLSLYYSEI